MPIDSETKKSLIEIVGEKYFFEDKNHLSQYGSSVNGQIIKPLCILFPSDEKQIIAIVKQANEKRFQIYAISRGKNWGYGCAQGTAPNQVILDLKNMNRILEVNSELCYMRIQPGVSQNQIFEHLQKNTGGKLQMDATGAGTDASVIGNILERGFGHTPYGNRFNHLVNMKIVLPTGKLIQTGFGSRENANALSTYPHGIGPSINGLFTQSNFGIVTEMTIELMPKPENFLMVIGTIKKERDLTKLVIALRELNLKNILNSSVHIGNKARVIGNDNVNMIGSWTFSAPISGTKELSSVKRRIIKKTIKKYVPDIKLWFINDRKLKFINFIDKRIKTIPEKHSLNYIADLLKGIPTNAPIQTLVDNAKLNLNQINPDDFPMNFRWISAVSRADEMSVEKLLFTFRKVFEEFRYEFRITLTLINPRTIIAIANISYEKSKEQIERALTFYEVCMNNLAQNGFYPYRSGSGMYKSIHTAESNTMDFLQALKKSLDPNDTLAPNKYGI